MASSSARPGPWQWLLEPQPAAGLAFCRLAFGLILFYEVCAFFAADWIGEYFSAGQFHFTYLGFSWVRPLAEPFQTGLFLGLGGAALCLGFGLWYRPSAVLFFLGFSYVFLLEKARYLNHFYLVILLAFLWIFLPADADHSLDAWRRGRRRTVPRIAYLVLRFQLGVVYGFAGIAKLNEDWLRAQPLIDWFSRRGERVLVGPLLAWEPFAWICSYGGLALDLLVVPFLLWRRSRRLAFGLALAFHLMNAVFFGIGIFPWMMIAMTTIFFEPDWPERWMRRVLPGPSEPAQPGAAPGRRGRLLVHGALLYGILQLAVPLRHFLYPGVVHWTEEGHRFSWHMKLRTKRSQATFLVEDRVTGESFLVDPRVDLTETQYRKMSDRPDMILEYAHFLAARMRDELGHDVAIYAKVRSALNDRHEQWLVDPAVDLARRAPGLGIADWIVPLEPRRPHD